MLFKEMMNKEREAGHIDGQRDAILELLELHGAIPEDILAKVNSQEDIAVLKQWLLAAAQSDSFENFRERCF